MPRKDDDSSWAKLGALGLEVAVGVGLGAVVGNWFDNKHHSAPWGVLIGTFVGFAAGMYPLIKEGFRANKD